MPVWCHFLLSLFHDCKPFGHKFLFIATRKVRMYCLWHSCIITTLSYPVCECVGAHAHVCVCVCVCMCAVIFIWNLIFNKWSCWKKKEKKQPFTCQLPDNSSVYTAELRAILLALKHVYYSKEKSFLILSDSLSSLQSILNLKYDHAVLVQILELYTEMTREGRGCFHLGSQPCWH